MQVFKNYLNLLRQLGIIIFVNIIITNSCAVGSEYNTFLPDLGDYDRTVMSQVEADFLSRQIIQDIYNQREMLDDYDYYYLSYTGMNTFEAYLELKDHPQVVAVIRAARDAADQDSDFYADATRLLEDLS